MDRGAWRATVHGVIKSWTRLSKTNTFTFFHDCAYTEQGSVNTCQVATRLFLPLEYQPLRARTVSVMFTQSQCPGHSRCSIKTQCTGGEIQDQTEEGTCPRLGQQSQHGYPALLHLFCQPSILSRSTQEARPFAHEEHILLLNCTFTFTQTISKSWKKCGVGVGGGTGASQEPGPPAGFPRPG